MMIIIGIICLAAGMALGALICHLLYQWVW
jgi:hypothetical protein